MNRLKSSTLTVAACILCATASAQEPARIEFRAFKVYGPLSGPLWDAHLNTDRTPPKSGPGAALVDLSQAPPHAWTSFVREAVSEGDLIAGGMSLHMEGDTLEWLGDPNTEVPPVLSFEVPETVGDQEAVTLKYTQPRLRYTRQEDGTYLPEVAELGESFSVTPHLRWDDEGELHMVRLWIGAPGGTNPMTQLNQHGSLPPNTFGDTTAINMVLRWQPPNRWTGVVLSRSPEPGDDPPEEAILLFVRVEGDAPPKEPAPQPRGRRFSVETNFLWIRKSGPVETLIDEHMEPRDDLQVQPGSYTAYTVREGSVEPVAPLDLWNRDLMEKAQAWILSAPRLSLVDPKDLTNAKTPGKVVLRDAARIGGGFGQGGLGGGSDEMTAAPARVESEVDLGELTTRLDATLGQALAERMNANAAFGLIMDYNSELLHESEGVSPVAGTQSHPALNCSVLTRVESTEKPTVVAVELLGILGGTELKIPPEHWWKRTVQHRVPELRIQTRFNYELEKGPVWFITSIEGETYLIQFKLAEIEDPSEFHNLRNPGPAGP